jgi:hypothetical protein
MNAHEPGTMPRQNAGGFSWLNILLAIWVIISPFVLQLSLLGALWNNVLTGIAIGILALIRTAAPRQPGWSWVNLILGIWLIISPFVLGFMAGAGIWNNVILGIIIALVALGNASTTRAHATV